MNVSRMGRRLAVSGVATAIAAAGLVGASTATATAATGTTTYSCAFPLGGPQAVEVTVAAPALDAVSTVPAGQPIPAEFLNLGTDHAVDIAVKLPAAIASAISTTFGGITAIDSPDLGMVFGKTTVPVTGLTLGGIVPQPDGSAVVNATGTNGAFAVPAAGVYDIAMPKSFTMVPTTGTAGPVPVACTTSATPTALKTVTVTKNSSTTAAKAPTSIKKGAVAKLVASVSGGFNTATGKVVFKDGSTKLGTATLSSGKAVFKAKGLKVGKHTITAVYSGDGYRSASKSKAVVVKVVR